LLDPLCGTPYRLNFVAHILTARFATILKRFHFLSFILSYSAICSLHLSQLILLWGFPERQTRATWQITNWLIEIPDIHLTSHYTLL